MKRNLLILAVIATIVVALIIVLSIPRSASSTSNSRPEAAVGHPAPLFSLQTSNGGHLALRSLRGSVTLVNFWATWCHPCRSEMPLLAGWYRRYQGKGFNVLGVDKQEPGADVRSFTHQLGVSYSVVLDSSGSVAATYKAFALPVSYVIDRRGIIRALRYGVVDQRFWRTKIAPLLTSSG